MFDVTSVTSVFRSKDNLSEQENIIEALPFQEFIYVESEKINILADDEIFALSAVCKTSDLLRKS